MVQFDICEHVLPFDDFLNLDYVHATIVYPYKLCECLGFIQFVRCCVSIQIHYLLLLLILYIIVIECASLQK